MRITKLLSLTKFHFVNLHIENVPRVYLNLFWQRSGVYVKLLNITYMFTKSELKCIMYCKQKLKILKFRGLV